MHNPFVVAVSSISGGGKSTLVREAARLLSATALFFDDYSGPEHYPADSAAWLADGADPNQFKSPGFADDLSALTRNEPIIRDDETLKPSRYIVIEEPMGRERDEMRPLIDFVAVIDTPPQIALARRLLRDLNHFPTDKLDSMTHDELLRANPNSTKTVVA